MSILHNDLIMAMGTINYPIVPNLCKLFGRRKMGRFVRHHLLHVTCRCSTQNARRAKKSRGEYITIARGN